MAKSDKVNPNTQFLAFDALKFIKDQEQKNIKTEKKVLCEDDINLLNTQLNTLKKHDNVTVTYYHVDHYETISGMITELNLPLSYFKVNYLKIDISNLYSIVIN